MDTVKQINKISKKYSNVLLSPFRDYTEKELGKLDTAKSFMYLYLRFGKPKYDNRDEYKIMYEYILQYKDIIVTIHASYYEHVYLNLFFPKSAMKNHLKQYWKKRTNIMLKYAKMDIPYCMPYYQEEYKYTKSHKKKFDIAFDNYAKKYFSKDDYERLDRTQGNMSEHDQQLFYDFMVHMYENFIKNLTEEERIFWFSQAQLSDIPEIEKQCAEFIGEMRKGYYVRDVPMNILGYETENNKLIFDE